MQTRGRARFNLLRMNWLDNPALSVEPWQVEDYRALSVGELFQGLKRLGVALDEVHFKAYADHSSSPEELTATLVSEENLEQFDPLYLIIFELWRKLYPEKASLSIFCDELDHLITLYDQGQLGHEEALVEALDDLEQVLDEHADQGEDPKVLFEEISLYCAQDLESFIYDFASELIDREEQLQASEIIDGFLPYISDIKWFDFLQLRLLTPVDTDEADAMLARLLNDQELHPDLEFLLEMARFLVNQGSQEYFLQVIKMACPLVESEEDFQELLAITYEFYRLLDREEESQYNRQTQRCSGRRVLCQRAIAPQTHCASGQTRIDQS